MFTVSRYLTVSVVYWIAIISVARAYNGHNDLLVETKSGWVRGVRERSPPGEEADCWYGIPYAEPPIGELRFRHPQSVKKWSGIKDAAERPNSCVQLVDKEFQFFEGAEQWNPNTPISEDCLYLNVVAPSNRNRQQKLAVLVWIHGGGFITGSSTLDVYDPRTLAVTENVIVASMQYRVASLGFLYFGNNEAPGNAGLYDQLMALQFLKDNIERFGGDPDRITLFSESAGSASVTFHLMSPLSRNLFNRAILQSGSGDADWALVSTETSIKRGLKLAQNVDCPHDSSRLREVVSCLRTVNASVLVKKEWFTDDYNIVEFPMSPIVDGVFLEEDPKDALKNGHFKNTPILIGSNQDEGNYFLLYWEKEIFPKKENVIVDRETFIATARRLNPKLDEVKMKAVVFEYTDWFNPYDPVKNRDNLDKIVGDKHFTCGVNKVAHRYAGTGNNVYKYYYTHRSSRHLWPSWTGVMHADEIDFVFGKPLDHSQGYTDDEVEFSRLIMGFWANFAKTGNPNLYSNGTISKLNWPQHTTYGREYLELNDNSIRSSVIGRGPRLRQCVFWNQYLPELEQQSNKAEQTLARENCSNGMRNVPGDLIVALSTFFSIVAIRVLRK